MIHTCVLLECFHLFNQHGPIGFIEGTCRLIDSNKLKIKCLLATIVQCKKKISLLNIKEISKQLNGIKFWWSSNVMQTFGVKTFWTNIKFFIQKNAQFANVRYICYFKTTHLQDTNLTILISACNYVADIFKQEMVNHLKIKLMSIFIFGLNFTMWQMCPFLTSIFFRQLKHSSIGLKWKIQIFFCVVQNY